MMKTMIEMLEVGDPVSFDDHGKLVTGWLRFPPIEARTTLDLSMSDGSVRLVPHGLVEFHREATSPIGPAPRVRGGPFTCKPCGHGWDEHDDSGCLWMVCKCWLPGERK